jgi:hypothetical protein
VNALARGFRCGPHRPSGGLGNGLIMDMPCITRVTAEFAHFAVLRCYSGIVVGRSTAALTAHGLLSPRRRIIFLVITFVQGIYNYVPETNHVSRVYSVAAVLYLQSVLHAMLFRP